jgi:hypothetical protein
VPFVDRKTPHPNAPIAAAPEAIETTRQALVVDSRPHPEEETGQPLSPVLRQRMETLLDVPLREVRVFRNVVSRRLTASQDADAVTFGNEIHMAPGQGDPSTPSGQALLAHELSHVAQRSQGSEPDTEEETRAQQLEHAVSATPSRIPAVTQDRTSLPLSHRRAQPQALSPVLEVAPVARSTYGVAGLGPRPAETSAGSGNGGTAIARAPADRIPAISGVGADAPIAAPDATAVEEDPQKKQQDEANLVDRVVEAVMRRLRRETALESERRGAFHSEIGG